MIFFFFGTTPIVFFFPLPVDEMTWGENTGFFERTDLQVNVTNENIWS